MATRVSPAEIIEMHRLYNELGSTADEQGRKYCPQVHKNERHPYYCSAYI